jgi:RNA polymerase sigma factor (sigma-70 family)
MNDESDHVTFQRQQFEQSSLQCRPKLFQAIYSLTHDVDETEDTMQEAFLHVLGLMERTKWTRQIKRFDAYTIRTARHLQYDKWSRKRKEGWVSTDDESNEGVQKAVDKASMRLNDPVPGIETRIHLKELGRQLPLKVLLRGLSDQDWEILYLHDVDKLKVKEIAIIVNLSRAEVRYCLTLIKGKIRARARTYLKETGNDSLFKREA